MSINLKDENRKSKRQSAAFSLQDLKALQMQMQNGTDLQNLSLSELNIDDIDVSIGTPKHAPVGGTDFSNLESHNSPPAQNKDRTISFDAPSTPATTPQGASVPQRFGESYDEAPKLSTGEAYEQIAKMAVRKPSVAEEDEDEMTMRSCETIRPVSFDVTAEYGKNYISEDPPPVKSRNKSSKYLTPVPLSAQLEAERVSSANDGMDDDEDAPAMVNAKEFNRRLSIERAGQV